MVEQRHVGGVVQTAVLHPVGEELLGLGHARFGEGDRLVLLVDGVVARGLEAVAILGLDLTLVDFALLQLRNDLVDLVIEVGRLFRRARDDERRARFVDEDRVDFVDDGEVVARAAPCFASSNFMLSRR